jgi:hypothetical protein
MHHVRDYIACPFDQDQVPFTYIEARDLVSIMERGPANGGTGDLDRIHLG